MKLLHAAALAITPIMAFSASPALAQEEAQAPLTIDSSIEALMANEVTKAIVVKHLGTLDQHPAYGQFKSMSLVQLQPWSNGQVTDEIIAKVKADLAAL